MEEKDVLVTWKCEECDTKCELTFREWSDTIDAYPPINCPFVDKKDAPVIKPKWKVFDVVDIV